jgi:integrase/recombinase XerD
MPTRKQHVQEPFPAAPTGMRLYDDHGHRLYLTGSEREAFRKAAEVQPHGEVRTYCWTLLYTGCRPSEALALTADRVDFKAGTLTFESKKKRRSGIYRAVPVPAVLLDTLDLAHGIRKHKSRERLWTWSLKTAYTRVIEIMQQAGIDGPHTTPKGLRHGFGVACIEKGIPLNLVQRWLGHAQLTTTAIYANAVGEEERGIAARLWV